MKTKTKLTKKQFQQEEAKIYLFNTLFGSKLEIKEYSEKLNDWIWNGKTLADHIAEAPNLLAAINGYDVNGIKEPNKINIYGLVRRVSANGMNRQISLFAINKKKELVNITYNAHMILNEGKEPPTNSFHEHVIKVTGAGMDMVFHTVYNLSSRLFEGIEGIEEPGREGYILDKRDI